MSTRLGLVGLPNAGKSTLFNALTAAHAAVAPYPFTTTDQHVGVAAVEDPRLRALSSCLSPQRVIPTTLECVDIAGLVKGAHEGEGLGNQFLSHILEVDALLHVVRCFEDAKISHPMGDVDPVRDVEIVNTELLLKDLEVVGRRKEKEQKSAKGQDKQAIRFLDHLERWRAALSSGTPIRKLPLEPEAQPSAHGVDLLSGKPVLYAANVGEGPPELQAARIEPLRALAAREGAELVVCCAKLEAELAELDPEDRAAMMRELGVVESALPQVIRRGYALLRLVTFFTTASKILQAWTVRHGTKAPQAAGTIHTDFEQKFIRAEVIPVEALVRCGSEANARAQGLLRVEGKEYVVQDGDVIHFRVGP
ncbi:MAG: redox-regulated ATPase YchF [Candidatus Omnitrophica bacterium]|nr:redox-regulated ATPase YchF [Candidatus Omnitrophota bacterium]